MNREHHKWYSRSLGRDMELLVFGHGGAPMLVFPTSMGRFFDYEDQGMIGAMWDKIERGQLQVFCVDSVDGESWYNRWAQPRHRVLRHMEYEDYLINDVVPFVRSKNWSNYLTLTGCSFGGYHAVNFAFRHPELVSRVVSMSGAFDIHQFLDGYYDDNCYFNCPMDFLQGGTDSSRLDEYRGMDIVLAAGEWDICRAENERLSGILRGKGIAHTLDIWGNGMKHDWPWWRQMAVKFF